jgi:hypothetical protein
MDRARELYGDQRHSVSAVKSQFDRPMKEIVEDWDEQLGSQSDVELARFLGVTTMTIHRWRTNSAKPDLTALVRYNQLVTMLLRQMRGGRQQVQTSAKARANRR